VAGARRGRLCRPADALLDGAGAPTLRAETVSGKTTTYVRRQSADGELRLRLRLGGEEWTLDRARPELALGRDADNDVVVDREYVSRHHATIEYADGEMRLRDSSSNGTFIVPSTGAVVEACRDTHRLVAEGTLFLGRREGEPLAFATQVFAAGTEEWTLWQGPTASAGTPDPAANAAVFACEGDYWTVRFEGETVRLKDAKGLRFLAQLLRHPGQEFHALDLAVHGAKTEMAPAPGAAREVLESGHVADAGSAGPVLDATAKAAYRQRLSELQEELEEAQQFNDTGRAEKARAEIEALATQLAEAVGLGGRDRPTASNAERARVMVTHRIRDALKKIRDGHSALGSHLGNTIKTGTFCAYTPEPTRQIDWTF